jgi:DNA (cytosine-5)-methyltransferase 1
LATPEIYLTDEEGPGEPEAEQEELFATEEDLSPVETYEFNRRRRVIVRSVLRRDGSVSTSEVAVDGADIVDHDLGAAFDQAWLKSRVQPKFRARAPQIRLADLFCGCGGLSVGVGEACRALGYRLNPLIGVDTDKAAIGVYQKNIAVGRPVSDPIESLLDSELGHRSSVQESRLVKELGRVDILVGGPPCQGHSDLNNHTRRNDSRNALFLKMARFAELFEPNHIIIENVLGVQYDRGKVFEKTWKYLQKLGYNVDGGILRAEVIGVPQSRPRMIMLASRQVPVSISAIRKRYSTAPRSFDWACGDLSVDPSSPFDRASTPKPVTKERIDYLFDHDLYELPDHMRPACHRDGHTYPSVYGRIRPHEPAPTITTGFMTMGQGRFTHPYERRTLTPHEGARIQCFPDWFDFGEQSRQSYITLIGNAVPPKLAYTLALDLLR